MNITTLERLRRCRITHAQLRRDYKSYIKRVLLGVAIWAAITAPLACASASVEAQVLGEGPVVAPTPTPPYVVGGDPMPRLYLDFYLPFVSR